MPFTVRMYVDPTTAIRAGKTQFGVQEVQITDADLAPLPEKTRAELADAYGRGVIGKGFDDGSNRFEDRKASEPTFLELQKMLEHRLAIRESLQRSQEEVKKEEARQQEEKKAQRLIDQRKKKERTAALEKWVQMSGTDSQKARLAEGLLPEKEIMEAVKEELFDSLDNRERYTPILKSEVCGCACVGDVTFTRRTPEAGLTEEQHDALTALREDAPKGADIEVVEHYAECPSCTCPSVTRPPTAIVTVVWNNIVLGRQYILQ